MAHARLANGHEQLTVIELGVVHLRRYVERDRAAETTQCLRDGQHPSFLLVGFQGTEADDQDFELVALPQEVSQRNRVRARLRVRARRRLGVRGCCIVMQRPLFEVHGSGLPRRVEHEQFVDQRDDGSRPAACGAPRRAW